MRFSAAVPRQPLRTPAVAELVRRLLNREQPAGPAQSASLPQQELPADLDQRVRLVGEW